MNGPVKFRYWFDPENEPDRKFNPKDVDPEDLLEEFNKANKKNDSNITENTVQNTGKK